MVSRRNLRYDLDMNYWQDHHRERISKAENYKELFLIAENILRAIPPPVGQVCGPISTGGVGSVEIHVQRFETAINHLLGRGINMFNQIPFQREMFRILSKREADQGYDHSLLNDFYLPIFESGLVHTLYFLPDWESSTGARWEHQQANRLKINVEYLDF